MTLKLRILRSLTRLFMILVSLTRSLFSEKMLISNICIHGLMPNLIKKSWTVSNQNLQAIEAKPVESKNLVCSRMCTPDFHIFLRHWSSSRCNLTHRSLHFFFFFAPGLPTCPLIEFCSF